MKDVVELLQSGSYILAIVLVLIMVIIKLDVLKLFSLFSDKDKKRFEQLTKLLESGNTSKEVAKLISEDIDLYAFCMCTRISVTRKIQTALMEFKEANNDYTWRRIKRIVPYIDVDESGEIIYKFTRGDRVERWYNSISASILLVMMFVVLFFTITIISSESYWQILVLTVLGIFCLVVAMFLSASNWGYYDAKILMQTKESEKKSLL